MRQRWTTYTSLLEDSLFPLLVGVVALLQQDRWPILLSIGQLVSVLLVAASCVVLVHGLPDRRWPLFVVAAVVVFRAGRFVMPGRIMLLGYTVALAILMSAVGALLMMRKARVLYRQLAIFCMLSFPLMAMQLTGVSSWTQVLRNDFHVAGEETLKQYPTLFVAAPDVVPTTIQARPAGLLAANNTLSIFLLFIAAIHYGRPGRTRLTWSDLAVCGVCVLSMAKIVFLELAVLGCVMLVFGRGPIRRYAIKVGLLLAVALASYAYLFPGMWVVNQSVDLWLRNFYVRFADLLLATRVDSLADLAYRLPGVSARSLVLTRATQSGYATIVRALPLLAAAAVALLPFYLKGVTALRRARCSWSRAVVFALIAFLLVPLVTSFLESSVYWFFSGVALLPLWTWIEPALHGRAESARGAEPGPATGAVPSIA